MPAVGSHFLIIYTILIENKLIYNLKIADFQVKAQQQYDDDYHWFTPPPTTIADVLLKQTHAKKN